MSDSIRRSAVRAMGASSVISVMIKIVSLLSTLVLLRLLTPSEFGLMAIATTVTGVVGFFNEIGLGSAIVQRAVVRDDEIDGCFGIALLASSALCLLVMGLSWPIAAYYGLPDLQPVLMVLAFSLFYGALNTIPLALLRKALRFQSVVWAGGVAVVVQALVAIPLAWLGLSYWSIVIGFLVGQAVATVWYWRASGWRPGWPLSLRKGRSLMSYGLNITYTRVLWHVYMNADKLIIGKLLGPHAVGVYDVAKSLANLPTSQISGIATNVASPVFSRLQADMPRLGQTMLRLVRGVATLTFPILVGMALLAEDLVFVLMGAQWSDAVWPMRALCVGEMVASIASLQSQVLISSGNVTRLIRYNMACALVLPVALGLGGWLYGLIGVALSWVLVYPLLYAWLLREVLVVTALPLRAFAACLRGPVLGTLLMAAALLALRTGLAPLAQPLLNLLAGIGLGALVYLAFVIYIDRTGLAEIRQVLGDFGVPAHRLAGWPFARLDPAAPTGEKHSGGS